MSESDDPTGRDPTVEDATAKEVLGHGELQPILPGPGRERLRALPAHRRAARSCRRRPRRCCTATSVLFQTVHQTSELWLKLAVFETEEAIARIGDDDLVLAVRLLGPRATTA